MSQSQIASTRSATAAEGRMLLEKPSGTMCSPPQLGGCNSSCERPIGCADTTRKAPCCGKSGKKPKPNATPHSALGVWRFSVAFPRRHYYRRNISPRCSARRDPIDRRTRRNPSVKRLLPTGATRHHADTLDRYWYCIANRRPSVLCANVRVGSKSEKLNASKCFPLCPQERTCRLRCVLSVSCQKRAFSSLSRMGCPARGAVRRLRTVGGIGVVLGYSRDEPAGGERLQVCLHRVSNIVGLDLRSSALGIDWRYHRVRAAQVFAMKSSRS